VLPESRQGLSRFRLSPCSNWWSQPGSNRFLSEAELAKLADALAAMEAEHRLSPTATAAIRLLLPSGCRKSEILSLRWEWADVERGVLRLPDSKTGAKVVPLAAAAVKLLADRTAARIAAAMAPGADRAAGNIVPPRRARAISPDRASIGPIYPA
jgi:integrase